MNRKPTLVLVFGKEKSVSTFEKNWLIKSQPLIDGNALIIHEPKDESVASILNLMIDESDINKKEYIFFLKKSKVAEEFVELSGYINEYYRNKFKEIKIIFTYLEEEDDWSEKDVQKINSISETFDFSMSYGDIFGSNQLINKSTNIPSHISVSSKLLFDLVDLSKFLDDDDITIDSDIYMSVKENILQLLELNKKYTNSIYNNNNES